METWLSFSITPEEICCCYTNILTQQQHYIISPSVREKANDQVSMSIATLLYKFCRFMAPSAEYRRCLLDRF